jgi:tape measure domain-containing protein
MASKQVQEMKLRLLLEGFEGLDKLKSSFRGLEKAIGPTDSAIQSARQSIIDFTGSGKQSIQSIQGQIDAFKGLQAQATIGGNVYRQLAGDVNRLSDTLKGLKNDYEEVGRAAKQTDKQIAAQFPARKPEAFRQQLAALNRQLDQLSVSARAYGDALTEITIRETAFGRAQARQGVIAGAQAVGAPLIGAMQPQQQLPNTLAALQLRISELSQDFQNLDRAGQPYQDTLAEINRLQRELSRATEDGNADRKEEIRARIENYRQITAENTALREQAAIRRSVERGRARAAGQRVIEQPMRQISGLYQQIGQIGMQPILGDIEMMGNSYTRVSNDIKRATNASNGSIQSLNAQRGAWQALRAQIDPTSNDFRRASKEIEQLDRRLGKLQQTQSRRMGGMQMAQAAGAAISGGIFGGPEGFLGGAIGGITGGVGGAFVGAAAGAQVGMLRQQLGGFADYAAQIQKMEIALKNAAGSQDQFNQAVAAANFAVRNLNVPQDVAVQGMTRLTAAVKGAKGQVSDAELVFKNVTSAIKATGGSAEDVDGAITAMVQVFSKGKVSAEELSGQLGERLPGAVTKFAEANEMTLPELQKALEQGQVGLNELMNFIVQLGDEYSGVAQQIANSSQDAGARLTVAFNDMRIAIGETLQPIGAQFQEAFAEFIEKITPALVAVLPKIAEAALGLVENLDILVVSAGAAFAVFGVGQLAAIGGIGGALLKLAAAAGTASVSLKALNATALLNPWTALAAGVAAVGVSLYNTWREQEQFNELLRDAPLDEITSKIDEVRQKLADLDVESRSASAGMSMFGGSVGFASAEAAQLKQDLDELISRQRELALYRSVGVTPKAGYAGPGFAAPPPRPAPTRFPRLSEDSGGRAKKAAKERESQLPQLMAELAVQQQIAQINAYIRQAQLDGNEFLKIRLEGEKQIAEIAGQIQAIQFEKIPADEAEVKRKQLLLKVDEARLDTIQRLRELDKQNREQITKALDDISAKYTEQIEKAKAVAEMVKTGISPALAEQYYEIDQLVEKEKELLEQKIAQLELTISSLDAESAIREELEKQVQATKDLIKARGEQAPETKEKAKDEEERKRREREAADQAERLKAMYANIVGTLEDGIVGSLMAGIEALIGGTKNLGDALKEIASGILKDIGQTLLRFAVNLGMRAAFPGAFAAKGAYFSGGQADFAQNSIKPFATGGIVTKPTFFKYADGGTFNNGVMGEAGPEAIMPLKRGADGKLGVAARLDGAMKRYRSTPGSAAAAAEGDAASLAAAGAATMEPIDVRYSVERINSVDYVTADQFQTGMAQAAQQGALQGERRAMRSLKNSSATRRSVGI